MGIIADTFDALTAAIVPQRKIAVGATVQTWEHGTPQHQKESYYRYALEGYSGNEVMFACVEELASSAAEPRLVAEQRAHLVSALTQRRGLDEQAALRAVDLRGGLDHVHDAHRVGPASA